MSSNTAEQKRAHKAQQYFRDLLKQLRETGACDWPYGGRVFRVLNTEVGDGLFALQYNALVKHPRKRGFKVTPVQLGLKGSQWILGPTAWKPQNKHILGFIVGEVHGPRQPLGI